MAEDNMEPVGITLPSDLIDDLDAMKREWDARESRTVYRSEVAREAITLGLVALENLDSAEYRRLHTNERKALVRQAILDHLRTENGEPDV